MPKGTKVTCFVLERQDLAREYLRRFVYSDRSKCSGPYGYHNAEVTISAQVPYVSEWEGEDAKGDLSESDPRWPKKCDHCAYEFQANDQWQHRLKRLYRRADNGELTTTEDAPAGAMWYAPWAESFGKGPDGKALIVMLPDGTPWQVDSPATNSKTPWHREGKPPKVTASPSIRSPRYHGFLRNGVLEPCGDSQT